MKKVISLLLALVMTLSLCSGVWATDTSQGNDQGAQEEEYTLDTLLAEVDKVEGASDEAKAAAKGFLADNFSYDGRFVVLKGISFWDNRFYETNNNKAKAKTVLDSYTAHKAVLENVPVKYGAAYDMTVDSLMNMYRAAQEYPVIQEGMPFPEGGPTTGEVVGVGNLKITEKNKGYIETQDVTGAKNFFNEHFRYVDLGEEYSGDHAVDFKAEFYDSDGKLIGDKVRSVIAEYNNELRAGSVVLLNELNIHMPNRDGTECYHFWRLMDMYRRQLNGGDQGGGDQGGNDRPSTGNITDPEKLNENAQEFIGKYIGYYYNSEHNVVQLGIKDENDKDKRDVTVDNEKWYTDPAAREAVIAAYNAFCNIGPDVQNELNRLFVMDDNGNPCTFYSYMLGMRQLADNGSGSYTDTDAFNAKLRAAGYVAPVLGRDLKVEFPYQLVRGTDYDYTYDQSSGHLTITVKKGSAERWLDAAEGIYFTMDSVMVNMTLMNTRQKSGYAFWSGIGEGGTWNQFVDGSVKSTYPEESIRSLGYGDSLAPVNRDGDKISVTSSSDNKTYRVLMVWGDENEAFKDRTKWLFTYEIKVEESFYYSKAGVSNVGKMEMDRVDASALGKSWIVDKSEEGVLKLVPRTEMTGEQIGTVTVTAPTGYTFDRDSSYVANGDDGSLNGKTGEDKCTITLYNRYRNTFVLVWKNDTKVIQESLDVYRLDEQLENLGKYDANGETVESSKELPVTKPEAEAIAAAGSASGVTVKYDASTGSFYTTFDKSKSLPSYEELQKGVLLEPDSSIKREVTHFRAVTQSTEDQVGHSKEDVINLVQGMCAMEENLTYSYTDTQDNSWRTLPYVDTDYQEIGGIQVSYAADQGYRYKIVQWLHKEDNGTYTVLGYSYVWGRNDAFINEIQTSGVAAGSEAASEEPFVIGEGMQLRCDRYPQYGGDGKIQYFQFRAYGDHEGDYILYIPYEYFDMKVDDGLALRDRGQRPRINHYYEDHALRETIVGEYTEYGVKFTTKSFSPFVVDCSTQTTPPRYYYNSTTAAAGKQDGGNSPTTFDAGIALYVGMALTSAAGMAWVGKKRR